MLERILVIIGTWAGYILFGGLFLKFLWNWIMPYLFELPTISFWMAIGIILLINLLFNRLKLTKK